MLLVEFCLCLVSISGVLSVESSRTIEGYPAGLLSECPGSSKQVVITQNSLKRLSFLLLSPGNFLTTNITSYNYFQMRKLAKRLDFTKKTVLYMNGYMDSSYMNLITPAMGSVYNDLGYNVLLLEYMQLSSFIYPKASRVLPAIGKRAAEMLSTLIKHGLDPDNFELLGISFGGQGISFIGKNFREITGRNVSRLTSIDPAGPCFRRLGAKHRIDASDADFVNIIHTNIDGYGFAAAVGHVDFYINGGEYQFLELPMFPCGGMCSHLRSFTIWVAALYYPGQFIGVRCNSIQDARDKNCFEKPLVTNVMGMKTDRKVTGIFYVSTTNLYPYFLGKKGLSVNGDFAAKYMQDTNSDDVLIV